MNKLKLKFLLLGILCLMGSTNAWATDYYLVGCMNSWEWTSTSDYKLSDTDTQSFTIDGDKLSVGTNDFAYFYVRAVESSTNSWNVCCSSQTYMSFGTTTTKGISSVNNTSAGQLYFDATNKTYYNYTITLTKNSDLNNLNVSVSRTPKETLNVSAVSDETLLSILNGTNIQFFCGDTWGSGTKYLNPNWTTKATNGKESTTFSQKFVSGSESYWMYYVIETLPAAPYAYSNNSGYNVIWLTNESTNVTAGTAYQVTYASSTNVCTAIAGSYDITSTVSIDNNLLPEIETTGTPTSPIAGEDCSIRYYIKTGDSYYPAIVDMSGKIQGLTAGTTYTLIPVVFDGYVSVKTTAVSDFTTPYSVSYDLQGGTAAETGTSTETAYYTVGTEFTLPNAPTKNGYTFGGWQDNADTPGTTAAGGKYTMWAKNIVFTALWTEDLTTSWIMKGDFDSWTTEYKFTKKTGESIGSIAYCTMEDLVANTWYNFKLSDGTNWYGEGSVTAGTETTLTKDGDNLYMQTTVGGNYIFKVDYSGETPTLTVTYPNSYSRTVTSGNLGSICLPYASTVAYCSGVDKVFKVQSVTSSQVVLETVDAMEAGVPYIFRSSTSAEDTETIIFSQEGEAVSGPVSNTYLVGNFAAMTGDTYIPAGSYILQNNQFKYVNENTLRSGVNRCYLKAPATTEGARETLGITIDGEGTTTAIDALNAVMNNSAEIYDLSGKRLQTLQKGINIVNGKKIIIK